MEERKVLIGKDDWLFLQNDTNRIVEQNNGTLVLAPNGVKRWVRLLESRFSMLKARGIGYHFLVAPNKESVYPEHLPKDYTFVETRPVHQIDEGLMHSFVKIHYPLDLLKLYKDKYQLYPKVNTHWNEIGAYIAYRYLANVISKEYPIRIIDWGDITFEDFETCEDLGSKLNPQQFSSFTRGVIKEPSAQFIYDNGVINTGRIRISLNKNTHLPTAAVFHDSFSEGMQSYLAESFSQVHFYHTTCVDYDEVDRIKPDIVISEVVERFLISIPSDF